MLRFDGVAPDDDDEDGGDAVVVVIVVNLNPVDVIHFICLFNMQQLLLKDIFQKQKQQEGHIISRLVPAAKATTQFNSSVNCRQRRTERTTVRIGFECRIRIYTMS